MTQSFADRMILILLLLCMALLPIMIKPVKTSGTIIWVPDDYSTIQEAVDAAGDGDTVRVRAGTYSEDVIISGKSISLVGDNAASTVIRGLGKAG